MLKFTPLIKIKTRVLTHLKAKKNQFWQCPIGEKLNRESVSGYGSGICADQHFKPDMEKAIAKLVKAEIKLECIKRRYPPTAMDFNGKAETSC